MLAYRSALPVPPDEVMRSCGVPAGNEDVHVDVVALRGRQVAAASSSCPVRRRTRCAAFRKRGACGSVAAGPGGRPREAAVRIDHHVVAACLHVGDGAGLGVATRGTDGSRRPWWSAPNRSARRGRHHRCRRLIVNFRLVAPAGTSITIGQLLPGLQQRGRSAPRHWPGCCSAGGVTLVTVTDCVRVAVAPRLSVTVSTTRVGAGRGVGLARAGRSGGGAVTEVPRTRRDAAVRIGGTVGEAGH